MIHSGTTRLYISPLHPLLLETILPPSVRVLATDISFHTIQTFPEHSYGFVNLPAMEAEKLKKKLNGSVLRGKKISVQEARPDKIQLPESDSRRSVDLHEPEKAANKRKRDRDTIQGYELPSRRHVKRGWTEPPGRGNRAKKSSNNEEPRRSPRSKYTEKAECVFRTKPPPCGVGSGKAKDVRGKKGKESMVVHEFAKNTTYPSFLRSSDTASGINVTHEFVEGTGWVDREGQVKESDTVTRMPRSGEEEEQTPEASGSGDKDTKSCHPVTSELPAALAAVGLDSNETSSSELSSSEASSKEGSGSTSPDQQDSSSSLPHSGGGSKKETPKYGNPWATPDRPTTHGEVHPLKALFKRPANSALSTKSKPALEIKTQFTFFGPDDVNDEGLDDDINVRDSAGPYTPFTKRDLQSRMLRSAAPTPDTVEPSRSKFWELIHDDDDEGDDDDPKKQNSKSISMAEASSPTAGARQESGDSSFAAWFWANRGENNRSWKRRRREAAKEKRQRENRQRGAKGK